MNKAREKRLSNLETAFLSPLEREIYELLLELYGTTDPDPAVLHGLMAKGREAAEE